jgi:hypothetical protein
VVVLPGGGVDIWVVGGDDDIWVVVLVRGHIYLGGSFSFGG